MFDNLTKEIIYYSLIPVAVIVFICLILLLLKKRSENAYKYNYVTKILLMLVDSMVLSLITGYAIWATLRFIRKGTLSANILYFIIFIVLIISLIILLIVTCMKLYKDINYKEDNYYLEEKEA